MPKNKSLYQQTMQPWPPIAKYAKYIQLQNIELDLFYYEAGSHHEQVLIMLHGLGDETDTWRHVFLPISEHYHTFAIDLPGFGRSDKPDVDYTPEFMINVVVELLAQLKINKAILLGSSLGGILAHGLAIFHPERVKGLILVGGALLQTEPIQDRGIRLMRVPLLGEWLYTRLRKDPDAAYASLSNVYHQLEKLPEKDRKFLYNRVNQRVWSDGQRRAYLSTLRNLSPWIKNFQAQMPDLLSNLKVPTLIIRGEYDQLFSDTSAKELVKIQPRAKSVVLPNVGHLPHQENPEVFLQEIRASLNIFS